MTVTLSPMGKQLYELDKQLRAYTQALMDMTRMREQAERAIRHIGQDMAAVTEAMEQLRKQVRQ